MKRLIPLLIGLTVLLSPMVAKAERAATLRVTTQQAQGTSETGMQRIVLGMQGVNLSFVPTGETIQKVWLDNPARVLVDFDGCLAVSGQTDSSNCNGASIIRLRQLPKPIEFPSGMFPDGNIQMTVITSSKSIYQFTLVLAQISTYGLVEVIPSPPIAGAQLVSVSQEYQQTVLGQLSRGLAYAEAKKLIDTNSQAYAQAKSLIAAMQSGISFAEATKQTNIPSSLVERLRSYGSQTNR